MSISLDQFDIFFKPLPDPLCLINTHGQFIKVNPAASNFFKLDQETLYKKTLFHLVSDSSDIIDKHLRNWSRCSAMIPGPLTIITGKGEMIHCNCEGSLVQPKVSDSQALIMVRFKRREVFSKNFITLNEKIHLLQKQALESKLTKDALAQSNAKFEAMFNSIPDAVMFLDINQTIVKTNPAFYRMFGYNEQESSGKTAEKLYAHKDDFIKQDKKSIQTKNEAYEVKFKHKNNNILWTDTSSTMVKNKDDNIIGFIYIIRDITERKEADQKLRLSEQHLSALAENIQDGFLVNLKGKHVFANRSIAKILGYEKKEDLHGTSIADIVHPDELKKIQTRFKIRLKNEIQSSQYESVFITQSGQSLPVEITVATTTWEDQVAGLASIRDISERKKTEKELDQYRNQLEIKVQERTTALEATNKELEAFSYSVSHDLRAPLRSIHGFSQILLEEYSHRIDEKGKDYLNRVSDGTIRMGKLIDDMLKLSRTTRKNLSRELINISKIAENIAEREQQKNTDRNVQITIEQKMEVYADSNLIEIALENLISNAMKFTSKQKNSLIEFGINNKNGENFYYVKDNGAGFDQRYAKKLFGAFQRLHRESEFPGTGIGLATVQRIIHRHGGRIWAEADLNRGATFFFTLSPAK